MKNYELYEKCLIGAVKDTILNENSTDIPKETDIGILARLIKVHKLTSLLYPYFAAKGIKNEELLKDFNFWLTVDSHQQYYLEKIRAEFEAAGIRFVCIKGAFLKTLYPESYMRSSGDLDIFVDDENTEKARDIMQKLGFTVDRFSHKIQDDEYSFGNFMNVEIHRELISNKCEWSEKCQEIVDRITPKTDGSYEYVMSNEDFYLHLIGHMAKHMKYSGCGIRMVLDIWIYLKKLGDTLDRETLDKRLKYCGLDAFEKETVKLIDYWFEGTAADATTKEFAEYVFESGIFGNQEQHRATEMAEGGAFKRLVGRFFLPYGKMCLLYPVLEKAPVLLPVYWVIRGVNVILFRQKRLLEEANAYDGIDAGYAKKTVEFKKRIGL